jgi:ParB family chromosome partitioning protein
MADALSHLDPRPERSFQVEFEEPALLTLGAAYEDRARFAGSAYQGVLRRVEAFLAEPLPEALSIRRRRGQRLLEVDAAVTKVVDRLRHRGLESPYLEAFVVARIHPLRSTAASDLGFDELVDRMLEAAAGFDVEKVGSKQISEAAALSGEER